MPLFSDIQKALETTVNTISGHPFIDWDNTLPYEPTIGTPFWRVKNLTLDSEYITAGKVSSNRGILRVDVYVPRDKGSKAMHTELDRIEAHFAALSGSVVKGVASVEFFAPSKVECLHEPSWFHGAIKIEYVCYN